MTDRELPSNVEIADRFDLIADLLDIEGGQSRHRILAYRRGATRIRGERRSVATLALAKLATELPDIGGTLQDKIVELCNTGRIAALDRLSGQIPPGLAAIARLQEIGPKRARAVWSALGVVDMDGLAAALADGRLATVEGIGPKTITAVTRQLAALAGGADLHERIPAGRAYPLAMELVETVRAVAGVTRAEIAGGLRRGAETVHDIDIAVATNDSAAVHAAIAASSLVADVLSAGARGTAVATHAGIRAEFRYTEPDTFGNLLQHLTGSKAHNVRLRERAVRAGRSMSEHGVADADGQVTRCADEAAVYALLGLPEIDPELREDTGEIAAADAGLLPHLVTVDDLRGDLHVHTTWSDGRDSLPDMVAAARDLGLEYLGISDHSKALAMARGLDADRVRKQWDDIDAINATNPGITVLKACEVDVLADGTLDHDDELLAGFDWVTASLHSGFRQSERQLTDRILAAIDNPLVNAIGHPTGRMFGRREGYPVDLEAIVERAAATGTALEINAQPKRMDLNADMARRALAGGVRLIIGTDAHSTSELAVRRYGIAMARRAGAASERIVNCLPLAEVRAIRQAAKRRG
jgi:DNA polymerase (family 10)